MGSLYLTSKLFESNQIKRKKTDLYVFIFTSGIVVTNIYKMHRWRKEKNAMFDHLTKRLNGQFNLKSDCVFHLNHERSYVFQLH